MHSLKSKLIRLGSREPDLQPHLEPVIDRISTHGDDEYEGQDGQDNKKKDKQDDREQEEKAFQDAVKDITDNSDLSEDEVKKMVQEKQGSRDREMHYLRELHEGDRIRTQEGEEGVVRGEDSVGNALIEWDDNNEVTPGARTEPAQRTMRVEFLGESKTSHDKTSSKLIRLGSKHPDLQPHLEPILNRLESQQKTAQGKFGKTPQDQLNGFLKTLTELLASKTLAKIDFYDPVSYPVVGVHRVVDNEEFIFQIRMEIQGEDVTYKAVLFREGGMKKIGSVKETASIKDSINDVYSKLSDLEEIAKRELPFRH